MSEATAGLTAALMLARGRAEGVLMPGSSDTSAVARQSFWSLALCLPLFLAIGLLERVGVWPATAMLREVVGMVVGWAGFALLTHHMAARIGRAILWPRYIALWNWCNLVQYLLICAASLLGLAGLPDWVGQTAWVVALGWALWLEWFATRLSLALPGLAAAALVGLDVSIGLVVSALMGGR